MAGPLKIEISGPKGSGKTTLACAMVEWLHRQGWTEVHLYDEVKLKKLKPASNQVVIVTKTE